MISQRQWIKWRPVLGPIAFLYWGISWWRNFFYTVGFFITRRVAAPVVSIGNLSVGGTGKTPATIFIAQYLADLGYSVGIVSRGYGRTSSGMRLVSDGNRLLANVDEAGDEPFLMASRLPHVAVLVDEDRYRGAAWLVEHLKQDVIVLDDAFQHRGLARDCDIVLLDATSPPSDYRIFPSGALRERLSGLNRAQLVVWTRTHLNKPYERLRRYVDELGVPQIESWMAPGPDLIDVGTGEPVPARSLQGKPLLAVCGIAHPRTFYHELVRMRLEPDMVRYYPDHHCYTADDRAYLLELAKADGTVIVTTEKDAVKLGRDFRPGVYALRIEFSLSEAGRKVFEETLLRCLPLPPRSQTAGEA